MSTTQSLDFAIAELERLSQQIDDRSDDNAYVFSGLLDNRVQELEAIRDATPEGDDLPGADDDRAEAFKEGWQVGKTVGYDEGYEDGRPTPIAPRILNDIAALRPRVQAAEIPDLLAQVDAAIVAFTLVLGHPLAAHVPGMIVPTIGVDHLMQGFDPTAWKATNGQAQPGGHADPQGSDDPAPGISHAGAPHA